MRLCAVLRATLRDVLAAELGDVAEEAFAAADLAFAAAAFGFAVAAAAAAAAAVGGAAVGLADVVEALLLAAAGGEERPGFIWIILRVRVGGGGSVTAGAGGAPAPGARRFFPRAVAAGADAASAAARAGGGRVNVSMALDCDCCAVIPRTGAQENRAGSGRGWLGADWPAEVRACGGGGGLEARNGERRGERRGEARNGKRRGERRGEARNSERLVEQKWTLDLRSRSKTVIISPHGWPPAPGVEVVGCHSTCQSSCCHGQG